MATTTNYAWETPDDTDLVKDGALAIRTLGSSIDTTTKALNPSTTLGDIEYRSSTANTNTRLAIGSTGQILTVSGGVPTWATPAGGAGGMTSIASGSFSGSTLTLSSISGSYKDLKLEVRNLQVSTNTEPLLSVNALTGIYNSAYVWQGGSSAGTYGQQNKTRLELAYDQPKANASISMDIYFHDYTNTTSYKIFDINMAFQRTSDNARETVAGAGNATTYNAIDTIDLRLSTGTFTAGTYILYGVN